MDKKPVGNGQKTRFWLDVWIGEVPLKLVFPRLFSIASDPLATISLQGYWDGPEWRWSFSWGRTLRARDKVEWTEPHQLLAQICLGPDEPDKLIWVPNKSGLFTVKSFCHEMSKTNPSTLKEAAHKLWKGIVPHRIEIFAWIAMMEKLNTREKLAKLNIIQCNENQCALCELEPESSSHLFLQCSVAQQIWNWWLKLWNLSCVLPLSIKDTFIQWHYPRTSKFFKKIWAASFFVILWSLWKERNARAFSNKALPPSDLQDLIILRLSWWVKGWAPEFPYSPDEVRRNPTCLQWFSVPQKSAIQKLSLQWCSPSIGQLKWNVDASFNPLTGRSAIGGVLRNEKGDFLCLFSTPIPPMEINSAEVLAIHRAIKISLNSASFKVHPLVIESDSANAVNWCGRANSGPWNLRFILNFINAAPSKGLSISILHRGRSSNAVADALAKQGLHRSSEFVAWL